MSEFCRREIGAPWTRVLGLGLREVDRFEKSEDKWMTLLMVCYRGEGRDQSRKMFMIPDK